MSEGEEYVLFGDNKPFLFQAIDRVMERTGGERITVEGGVKVWQKGNREFATGFSFCETQVAKIRKELYPSISSEVRTIPVSPLDDHKVITPYSQELYQDLLSMHRHWLIVTRLYFLTALIAFLTMVTLRLLIYFQMFQSYVSIFELYSGDPVLVILLYFYIIFGAVYWTHMNSKPLDLLERAAEPPESIALLVRLPHTQELELSTGLQRENDDDDTSPDDAASVDRASEFTLAELVSDHITMPKHSLYAFEVDVKSQAQARDLIHERGGEVLTVGRSSQILRAIFNLRMMFNIVSILLVVSGLVITSVICTSLFTLTSLQYQLALLTTAVVAIILVHLLGETIWLWLERHLHFFTPI